MQRIINKPEEWRARDTKKVGAMIRLAVSRGLLHEREDTWLTNCVADGIAYGLLEDENLVGFVVVKQIGMNAYGEATLWRHESYWPEVMEMLLDQAEAIGGMLYGAYYRSNHVAGVFYKDFERIEPEALPYSMHEELKGWFDEIQLIRMQPSLAQVLRRKTRCLMFL